MHSLILSCPVRFESWPQHASSADPAVQPTIDPNYFSEGIDLEILVDALKFLRKVTTTGPWKDAAEQEVLPGPSVVSDEQMRGINIGWIVLSVN